MTLLVGEPHDLVLERRAIARADALNLSVEQRRSIDVGAHEVADAIVGMQEVTVDLRPRGGWRKKREQDRRIVSAFDVKNSALHLELEIDALAIQPRRRPRLQTAPLESDRLERLGQLARPRLAHPPGGLLLRADVNQPVQECPRGHHQRATFVRVAVFHGEARDAPALDENASRFPDDPFDVRLCFERRLHPPAVSLLVCLRTRRPDGRAAASIEQLELNAGRVDGAAHQAAEGIDLPHEMALRGAADRRIARHVCDGVGRQRADADARAQARRGEGCLASRVASADDDDVELVSSRRAHQIKCNHEISETIRVFVAAPFRHHLPTQNREKMCASTSSLVRCPLTCSKATRAS